MKYVSLFAIALTAACTRSNTQLPIVSEDMAGASSDMLDRDEGTGDMPTSSKSDLLAPPAADMAPQQQDMAHCGGHNEPCCGTPGVAQHSSAPFVTYTGECGRSPLGQLVCWTPPVGYPTSGTWTCVVSDDSARPGVAAGGPPCGTDTTSGEVNCPVPDPNGKPVYTAVVQAEGGQATCVCRTN